MPLEIQRLTSESDLPEFCKGFVDSFLQPCEDDIRIFLPDYGSDPEAKAKELQSALDYFLEMFRSRQNCKWFKVIDSESGTIVSGSVWAIYNTNPYKDPQPSIATWYPEGPKRDLFSRCLELNRAPRYKYMARPHVHLQWLFTLPAWRRKGAAQLSMQTGAQIADSLELPIWIAASALGLPVYQMWGFQIVERLDLKPDTALLPPEEQEVVASLGPMIKTYLWRPPGGVYMVGEVLPWEK